MEINKKECTNHGRYPIWMKGSGRTYWRSVYEAKDGRCFVIWGDEMIEVKRASSGFVTVEWY